MVLSVILGHPLPTIARLVGRNPTEDKKLMEVCSLASSQSHAELGGSCSHGPAVWGKSWTNHSEAEKEHLNDLGGIPESRKPARSYRKCKESEEAAVGY